MVRYFSFLWTSIFLSLHYVTQCLIFGLFFNSFILPNQLHEGHRKCMFSFLLPHLRISFVNRCFQGPALLLGPFSGLQLTYKCQYLPLCAWRPSFCPQQGKAYSLYTWQARVSKSYHPLAIAFKLMNLCSWCINTPTPSLLKVVLNHVLCTISQSSLRVKLQWPTAVTG